MISVSTVYTEIDSLCWTDTVLITEYCLDGIFCFILKNLTSGHEKVLSVYLSKYWPLVTFCSSVFYSYRFAF